AAAAAGDGPRVSSSSPRQGGTPSSTPTTTWPPVPSVSWRRPEVPRQSESSLAVRSPSWKNAKPLLDAVPPQDRVHLLAKALSSDGYAATAGRAPAPGGGEQLCQHHCPVAHVAAEFPHLCEAEIEAFALLLGTPVRRYAPISHGVGD